MCRESLPSTRKSWTVKVIIDGQSFFLTCGEYSDGRLGEIWITASKAGTFLRGVLDTLARQTSISLQWGVPISEVIRSMQLLNYPPQGEVQGSTIVKYATSIADWVSQELCATYCSGGISQILVEKSAGFISKSKHV